MPNPFTVGQIVITTSATNPGPTITGTYTVKTEFDSAALFESLKEELGVDFFEDGSLSTVDAAKDFMDRLVADDYLEVADIKAVYLSGAEPGPIRHLLQTQVA